MALIVELKKRILHFDKEKTEVYNIVQARTQKVTFDQMLDDTAQTCGVNRAQAKACVEAFINRLSSFMEYGMTVQLGEFGSFKPVINSKAHRSPEEVSIKDVIRRKIRFYPGKRFRKMMSQIEILSFEKLGDGTIKLVLDEEE